MLMGLAFKLSAAVALLFLAVLASAQEVQVAAVKGGVMLSVPAQHSYQLMPGQTALPTLSVECLHKGKNVGHLVLFSPGGPVAVGEKGAPGESFVFTVNGKKLETAWVPYGDSDTYAYVAPSDAGRVQFLHALLGTTVTVEFHPFLTGTQTTATFDLSKLGEALHARAECGE